MNLETYDYHQKNHVRKKYEFIVKAQRGVFIKWYLSTDCPATVRI